MAKLVPRVAASKETETVANAYYATESMLALGPATCRYDAKATPAAGTETLFDFCARLIGGEVTIEHGDHAVY